MTSVACYILIKQVWEMSWTWQADVFLLHQIIFYEDRNFGGRYYECMGDCADLHSMFERCRSIRVESGMFMIYDRPGFMGNQYFMRMGEYSDYMGMAGLNDCVRSCRMIPMVRPSVKQHTYFDLCHYNPNITSVNLLTIYLKVPLNLFSRKWRWTE